MGEGKWVRLMKEVSIQISTTELHRNTARNIQRHVTHPVFIAVWDRVAWHLRGPWNPDEHE